MQEARRVRASLLLFIWWYLTKQFLELLRLGWGCVNKPYQTYRELALYRFPVQTLIVTGLMLFYFFLATTKSTFIFLMTFIFCVLTIYGVGKILGSKGNIITIAKLWTFTLLPTLGWFVMTVLSFALLPPPRTTSILGQAFSALFISASIGFLIWKVILYYLTLRFGLKFSLSKIIYCTVLIWPLWGLYWAVLYLRGIFKVPFI